MKASNNNQKTVGEKKPPGRVVFSTAYIENICGLIMHTSNNDVQGLTKSATQKSNRLIVARDENESMLTVDQARDLFVLEDGVLINRVMRGRRAMPGEPAGSPDGHGYLCLKVDNVKYRVHRIVWLLSYGNWPTGQIDHVNGVRDDNRIENLRVVSVQENQRNSHRRVDNTSGVTGVCKDHGGWRARIKVNGKRINLGFFKSFDAAVAARKQGESNFGFHPNHGATDEARRNGLKSLRAPQAMRSA